MLLPFGTNNNIISNSMAMEMNPYMKNEDYSQRYERFYKDDNFIEAYYNYHKQHHQHEQQKQQSSYNEHYNYETNQYKNYAVDMANDYADKYKSKYSSSYERDPYKKDSININKINCINDNININGVNAGDVNIGNKEQGYLGAYSSNGNGGYGSGEGYSKQDKGFDCTINNNNNNNNIAGGGNQTIPPEPTKATLNVSKSVTCTYVFGAVVPELACELLEDRITENQFLIQLTDDNPVPSQFPGSESGTIVTLGAGNYVVSETPDVVAIQADIDYLVQQFEAQSGGTEYTISYQVIFTGDCTDVNPNNPNSTEATGTIGAGESQTCNIENHFTITAIP
jgi:hypothetical protein